MKRLSRHVRSNLIGYVALFIALGGTSAYAANTVFSADIVDGQVKTADLANAGVTDQKLGGNSVNSGKVDNGSLTALDLAPGVGGSPPTAIVFAPTGCTGGFGSPSPGCQIQQNLPGGFVLKENCARSSDGQSINLTSSSPASSVTNLSFIDGSQTTHPGEGQARYGGWAGSNAILLASDSVAPKQVDGQIVYRNGPTVVTVTFSGYVNRNQTRCEFFATAVSNG